MSEQLATHQKFIAHARSQWSIFLDKRKKRLMQFSGNSISEKVSENILEDLFHLVMDWELKNITPQVDRADMVLSHTGLKRVIIETKRPGLLNWSKTEIEKALAQAKGYAEQQGVKIIAISDGYLLYAADIVHGGLQERLYVSLDNPDFPEDLWWLSHHGVSKQRQDYVPRLNKVTIVELDENELLHHKHKIPARCFGYVGDHNQPKTWKLPYLLGNNEVDTKRLPKAAACIISNFRGKNVKDIPNDAIPAVLKRLHVAAERAGKLPHQDIKASDTYKQLHDICIGFEK